MPLCGVWGIRTGGFRVSKGCLEDFLKSKNLAFDVLLVADNASGHCRIEFFYCYMPLWLFAFVYLISGGVMYVVRLNIILSFSSFLASLDVCHMQTMEPGI